MRRGRVKALALSLLCACLLTGCGQGQGKTASIYAMDTMMDVTAYGEAAQEAVDAAVAELNRLDRLLSAQREDSDIARVNAHAETHSSVQVSQETAELLGRALRLCNDTDGALDITIYPAMEAWGFYDKDYRVPSQEELTQLQTVVGHKRVWIDWLGTRPGFPPSIRCGVGVDLDLGAVGKGYAADRVAQLWRDLGVPSGLLYLGGNVQCVGARPDGTDWSVGIRDPEDENGTLCTVSGRDMAVVTSGAYQRNFEIDGVRYHHILDPETCQPARSGLASVTIVAQSGFLADGLSTAVYVMGLEKGTEFWRARQDFDMILYTDDHELYVTQGLADRVKAAEGLRPQVLDG